MNKQNLRLIQGKRCIQMGGAGALFAAICCFSPLLVVILSALGLGMVIPSLDLILLPALFVCLGLVGYGLRLRKLGISTARKGGHPK